MRFSKSFAIVLAKVPTLFFLSHYAACAADSDSKSGKQVLNGSVQDKEKMETSVKLLLAPRPAPKSSPSIQPTLLRSSVEQYSGASRNLPRAPALAIPMIIPHSNVPHIFQTGSRLQFTPALPRPFSKVEVVTPKPGPWNYTATPKDGIMIWSPGYATKHLPQPPRFSENTGLSLSSSGSRFMKEQRAQASILNQATPSLAPLERQAVQQVLPEKPTSPPANWNLWYERVAKAVYLQWAKNTTLGAGKALLELTVYATRNVDVKVLDFTEAAGANQNVPAENRFRQASLKAINVLDGADVWTFPASAPGTLKRVTFEMELNHAVGEAPGCAVVRMHTN